MIDWVTCLFPLFHVPFNFGTVLDIDENGQIIKEIAKWKQIRSSHEGSFQVKSVGGDGHGHALQLYVSGNPAKFLQGHNVFGSDDLVALMYDVYIELCKSLEIIPIDRDLADVKKGNYPVSMVDINYSYALSSRTDVLAWIRAAEYKSTSRRGGRPQMTGDTLYWQKKSKRFSLKAYSKGQEIEARNHEILHALKKTRIPEWANIQLRIELRLRKTELTKIGLTYAWEFTPEVNKNLFAEYSKSIQLSDQMQLTPEKELNLPARLMSTHILWKEGHDLRSVMSKSTYYKHRKEFLEFGIDITIRKEKENDTANVVPLVRYLEAIPSQIPQWAFDEGLVHYSAHNPYDK